MVNADLEQAQLQGADLSEAQLQGVNFGEAELVGADLSGADLSTAVGLTQEQLKSAIGSANTEIPGNLNRPEAWSK
jgi:uncharacterized protein YjbI with pentapeptide repeats